MNIHKIRITVEPIVLKTKEQSMIELTVVVETDGGKKSVRENLPRNPFESFFETIMKNIINRLKREFNDI